MGLPGQGLPRSRTCLSARAALLSGDSPARAAATEACARLTARLESAPHSGADCARAASDDRELATDEPRSRAEATMAENVELIPVDDQDIEERVFRAW